jgi:ribosomal protein S13
MELNPQPTSFRQRLIKHAPKTIIMLLMIALLGVGVKWAQSILENQKLQEEIKVANLEIERLKSNIVQAKQDKEIAVQQEQDRCKVLTTENEERIGAFATQAAKCIPLMKRFDIQYTHPKEKR